jgi:GxxExxY protein
MTELLYKTEVFEIIGAAIEVHKELGHGFLEAVYQEAIQLKWVEGIFRSTLRKAFAFDIRTKYWTKSM